MTKRLSLSMIVLSISLLLGFTFSRVNSSNARALQVQNSSAPQLKLNIADWWNAPVAIKAVHIENREVLSGSSFEATADWAKHLSIDAISKSEKKISYIAYAIDFTIVGVDSIYRIRLQDGTYYLLPGSLTAPNGLRISKGEMHNTKFTEDDWGRQASLADVINDKRASIVNVDLFVESVGYTDDTVWAFGSNLRRNKATSAFENFEHTSLTQEKTQLLANHASGSAAKATSASSLPLFACCATTMNYTSGMAKAVQVIQSCSACPPSQGGGDCPYPVPTKSVNSLTGNGSDGINQIVFVGC